MSQRMAVRRCGGMYNSPANAAAGAPWSRVWVQLSVSCLVVFEVEQDRQKCLHQVPLVLISAVKPVKSDGNFTFIVQSSQHEADVLLFDVESREDRETWMDSIRSIIEMDNWTPRRLAALARACDREELIKTDGVSSSFAYKMVPESPVVLCLPQAIDLEGGMMGDDVRELAADHVGLHCMMLDGKFDETMTLLDELGRQITENNLAEWPAVNEPFDTTERSLLHTACEVGWFEVAHALVVLGADVNERDGGLRTPLHFASQYANERLMTFLIAQGSNVFSVCENGFTPVHIYIRREKVSKQMVIRLLGDDMNILNMQELAHHTTPLHDAAASGYDDVVATMLSRGADPNAQTIDGDTPLLFAVMCGFEGIARNLITAGAEANMVISSEHLDAEGRNMVRRLDKERLLGMLDIPIARIAQVTQKDVIDRRTPQKLIQGKDRRDSVALQQLAVEEERARLQKLEHKSNMYMEHVHVPAHRKSVCQGDISPILCPKNINHERAEEGPPLEQDEMQPALLINEKESSDIIPNISPTESPRSATRSPEAVSPVSSSEEVKSLPWSKADKRRPSKKRLPAASHRTSGQVQGGLCTTLDGPGIGSDYSSVPTTRPGSGSTSPQGARRAEPSKKNLLKFFGEAVVEGGAASSPSSSAPAASSPLSSTASLVPVGTDQAGVRVSRYGLDPSLRGGFDREESATKLKQFFGENMTTYSADQGITSDPGKMPEVVSRQRNKWHGFVINVKEVASKNQKSLSSSLRQSLPPSLSRLAESSAPSSSLAPPSPSPSRSLTLSMVSTSAYKSKKSTSMTTGGTIGRNQAMSTRNENRTVGWGNGKKDLSSFFGAPVAASSTMTRPDEIKGGYAIANTATSSSASPPSSPAAPPTAAAAAAAAATLLSSSRAPPGSDDSVPHSRKRSNASTSIVGLKSLADGLCFANDQDRGSFSKEQNAILSYVDRSRERANSSASSDRSSVDTSRSFTAEDLPSGLVAKKLLKSGSTSSSPPSAADQFVPHVRQRRHSSVSSSWEAFQHHNEVMGVDLM
eukprot:TRINITY_DN2200_c0_g1_i1.p1 TRINITY_DN2200_c0_g1~~TRINITY_DN2200_c0_g1_i1.p1  ORF type:complete len:1036 (+),score=233.53 TRINITY_DN2200_c0_g1_i1:46-3153(+)